MKSLIQILILAAFVLSGSLVPALAGDAKANSGKDQPANIQLQQKEVKGSLKEIVGSLNLNQGEIIGNLPASMNYDRPWKRPEPFAEETKDLSRDLIEQTYIPVDRDSLIQQFEIVSGPGSQEPGSVPSADFAAGDDDLSGFISYATPE
jgi:hypothetical protein